jgi:hypothetical protein
VWREVTVRLTKKRLRDLHVAISIDDVLYEKFRRLNEEVDRKWRRIATAERVIMVSQRRGGVLHWLPILDVRVTSEGTVVMVGEVNSK